MSVDAAVRAQERFCDVGEFVVECFTADGETYPHVGSQAVGERVVRCRDCKYATPDTSGRKRYKGYLWCDKLTEGIGFSVAPSDFCAWGVRKED